MKATCPRCHSQVGVNYRALSVDPHRIPQYSLHRGLSEDGEICMMSTARLTEKPSIMVRENNEAGRQWVSNYHLATKLSPPVTVGGVDWSRIYSENTVTYKAFIKDRFVFADFDVERDDDMPRFDAKWYTLISTPKTINHSSVQGVLEYLNSNII